MDAANASVLFVLKQDLEVLNTILEKVFTVYPENINSWLFPSKSYNYVNEILLNKDLSNLSYAKYLELITDRLYCLIALITKYIIYTLQIKESKLLLRPKILTLGFSVDLFWNIIQTICNPPTIMKKKPTTSSASLDIQYKECQTEIISANKCDSCSSAMTCIESIMDTFQNHGEECIANEREKIRYKMYDITQFGSMMKTTTSIEKCLTSIFNKLHSEKRQNEQLRDDYDHLKKEIKEKLGLVTLLENEVDLFKDKADKENFKLFRLLQDNKELVDINNKSHLKIKTYEEIVLNLNTVIKTYQQKINKLVHEKNNLYKDLKKISHKQNVFSETLNNFIRKYVRCYEKYDSLQLVIEKNNCAVKKLNESVNNIKTYCTKIEFKLHNISRSNEEDCNYSLGRFRMLNENIIEHTLKVKTVKMSNDQGKNKSEVILKGNPIEDMSNQIKENNKTIQQLQDENLRLESILQKFNRTK